MAQGLAIRLFAFGGAYWPLATAHSDPLWALNRGTEISSYSLKENLRASACCYKWSVLPVPKVRRFPKWCQISRSFNASCTSQSLMTHMAIFSLYFGIGEGFKGLVPRAV